MNRTKLAIKDIIVLDRQRIELGNIDELAESIKTKGLIQPIVVNQDKQLIAGGRRLTACQRLGLEDIDVVYKETLSSDELHELELEENVRRLDMTWQERTLCITRIHELKVRRNALEGVKWGMRETGELMGMSKTHTFYCLRIAAELRREQGPDLRPKPDCQFWKCESLADAWRLIVRQEEDAGHAELARRQQQATLKAYADPKMAPLADGVAVPPSIIGAPTAVSNDDMLVAKQKYLSNPLNPPEEFDAYWAEYQEAKTKRENVVWISNRLFQGDCIKFMWERPSQFDHVVTDIPYGIDMEMLNQNNPHGGMVDIDMVEQEHDVVENMNLMRKFFPAAHHAMKESGFLVTWCDQMQWQFMYDLAEQSGFKVQRWPITWNKLHRCMNQSAHTNFTKNTEIAMVCRKGNATLVRPATVSVISASNVEARKQFGHPFAKPHELWQFILEHISIEGQVILEPFAGRGSAVVSMIKMNRHPIAVEIQPAHFNALQENVRKHYLSLNPNFTFL